jgi:hypothetical protein
MNMLIPLRTDKVIGRLLKVSMAAVDRKQPSLALTVFLAGIGPPNIPRIAGEKWGEPSARE